MRQDFSTCYGRGTSGIIDTSKLHKQRTDKCLYYRQLLYSVLISQFWLKYKQSFIHKNPCLKVIIC